MNLIYTFDINVNTDSHKLNVLKAYYTNSIISAKKLGYTTELYTNCNWFDELVDIKHNVTTSFEFWDMYKIIPLNRNDNYMLVDGDILFHNRFPILEDSIDIYFDGWESWIDEYDKGVRELTELGLSNVIPEWEYKPQRTINIGVLKINNKKLLNKYINSWNLMHEFCKLNKDKSDFFYTYGTIASQYLLTLLCTDEFSKHNFSNRLRIPNEYYTHYVGKEKYNLPIPKINKTLI